jgi:chemotaxis protein MotB
MRLVHFFVFFLLSALVSCVSTGKYKAMQNESQRNDSLYTWSQRTLRSCQDNNSSLTKQKSALKAQTDETNLQLSAAKENITQMRKQLHDLSTISSAQAESIQKTLDNMGAKDSYLQDLQSALSHRDSWNLAVVMELKATLGGLDARDLNIRIEKGAVNIDLSDKLLFGIDSDSNSHSYAVTDKGRAILRRLARALNDQPDMEIMVEGHTDSVSHPADSTSHLADSTSHLADSTSYLVDNASHLADSASHPADSTALLADKASPLTDFAARLADIAAHPQDNLSDNWELGVKRASSIVRILQTDYHISPLRMTAAGRSDYRSTRIIILPQLDQLLKVLDRKPGQGAAPVASGS